MHFLAGMNDNRAHHRQMEYKPVTAYTANQPVLVNGININTGPYPVLNFQPQGTQSPYIYVPIAEFSKVGASVGWNEQAQLLSVITDYYTDKSQLVDDKATLTILERAQTATESETKIGDYYTYGGKIEGMNTYQIGGVLWEKASEKEATGFTPGKSYKGLVTIPKKAHQLSTFLMLIDDNGKAITFRTQRV